MLFSGASKVSSVLYDEISIYIYTSSGRKSPDGGDRTLDIGTSNILEGYISIGFYHVRGPRLELALSYVTSAYVASRIDSSSQNYVQIYDINSVIKF